MLYALSIVKKYWPLLLFLIPITLIIGMSYFAESSKQHYEEGHNTIDPKPTAENSATKPQDNALRAYHPPVWAKFVAWPEGVGAWAVIFTMFVIAWQSAETREAAQATNRGLDMTKAKEGAKLVLRLADLNPKVGDFPILRFSVVNAGESKAYIGLALAGLHISNSEELPDKNKRTTEVLTIADRFLTAGGESVEIARWVPNLLDRYTDSATNGVVAFVHFHGTIVFRDAFEDSWRLPFHYIWRPWGTHIWMTQLNRSAEGRWQSQLEVKALSIRNEKMHLWKAWLIKAKNIYKKHPQNMQVD